MYTFQVLMFCICIITLSIHPILYPSISSSLIAAFQIKTQISVHFSSNSSAYMLSNFSSYLYFKITFIYNDMLKSQEHIGICTHKCKYLCNPNPYQDIEHYLRRFPHGLFPVNPLPLYQNYFNFFYPRLVLLILEI